MSNTALHISTDKTKYVYPDNVIVTATVDKWYPGPAGKIRLVIWVANTNNHIIDKYFVKPNSGNTVKWTIGPWQFDGYDGNTFDAQLEFGSQHADATFTY